MNKKAQLKIQQIAFMLIAVTLFFALVGLLVASVVFSNVKDSATSLEQKNALLLVSKLAESPEFSCEDAFGGSRINCVDSYKIDYLKENIETYSEFWGISGLEIIKIYPVQERIEILPSEGVGVSNFIVLCKKESLDIGNQFYDKCELAKIVVYYGDLNEN